MRITFVIPYFYPALGYGGAPRLAYDMARALVRRGHNVTVLTTDAGGEQRISSDVVARIHSLGLDGMRVHFYKNLSNGLAYHQRLFFPLEFFRHIRLRLRETDIVHIHDLRSFLSVASHHAARSAGKPYVLSPHGGLQRLGKKGLKTGFDFLWGRRILRDTSALCAISPLEEHDAAMYGVPRQRIYPFPPGIDADLYRNLPRRGEFAARWNLQSRRIVLFLGRLHWIKGADVLIEAIDHLREIADLNVVIAGPDDGAESQLKALVNSKGLQKKVIFTDFLDDDQKLKALVDSELVVVPSRKEGFPLTVLEAMASQTPVILTSACDFGDWVQRQPSLVLFRSEDAEDLARNLKTALCHPKDDNTLRDARNFVFDHFSLDALAARAERLYETLLRNCSDGL
jgi:glycosyltransferase involved in cell wall biosynthesis